MTYSVCVYCGSRSGARDTYAEDAAKLGTALAEAGMRLLANRRAKGAFRAAVPTPGRATMAIGSGLMGIVARAAMAAGGTTFGVIPDHLMRREVGKRDLHTFIVTETMHERKKVMVMNADAIVVLPGGAGSLDEFFEVLTWRQLGLHDKPIFLLNSEGYWDKLRGLLDHIVDQGFADGSLLEFFQTASDVPEFGASRHLRGSGRVPVDRC